MKFVCWCPEGYDTNRGTDPADFDPADFDPADLETGPQADRGVRLHAFGIMQEGTGQRGEGTRRQRVLCNQSDNRLLCRHGQFFGETARREPSSTLTDRKIRDTRDWL